MKDKVLQIINNNESGHKDPINNRKEITLILVSVISIVVSYLLVVFAKYNSDFVEKYYSRKFYVVISRGLNSFSNIFPFSVSEIFIGLQILVVAVLFIAALVLIIMKKNRKGIRYILTGIMILALNLLFFQISWGLNNYRYDVEKLFELGESEISKEELVESYEYLVNRTNQLRSEIVEKELTYDLEFVLDDAYLGYESLAKVYDFIPEGKVAVKPLLISSSFSKSSYTGIYLPYFSEANINNMPPALGLAFTASHEIAHQKGFASEDEANFLGFLSCFSHEDIRFNYSGHLAMLTYIGNSLYDTDQDLYNKIAELRSEEVLKDIQKKRLFWEEHTVESSQEFHNEVNDAFLKANNQPEGILNYSKVTELFVKAYSKGMFN